MRRLGAVLSGARIVVETLRPELVTAPYRCTARGHLVVRVYRPQVTRRSPRCPHVGCPGRLVAADHARPETLRALLVLAANTVHPAPDGIERIRARITAHAARRPWWRLPAHLTSRRPGGRIPGAPKATRPYERTERP